MVLWIEIDMTNKCIYLSFKLKQYKNTKLSTLCIMGKLECVCKRQTGWVHRPGGGEDFAKFSEKLHKIGKCLAFARVVRFTSDKGAKRRNIKLISSVGLVFAVSPICCWLILSLRCSCCTCGWNLTQSYSNSWFQQVVGSCEPHGLQHASVCFLLDPDGGWYSLWLCNTKDPQKWVTKYQN